MVVVEVGVAVVAAKSFVGVSAVDIVQVDLLVAVVLQKDSRLLVWTWGLIG